MSAEGRDAASSMMDSMVGFQFGRNPADEEDVEQLEREIQSVFRREKISSAFTSKRGTAYATKQITRPAEKYYGPRTQTAGEGYRRRKIGDDNK